MNPNEQQMQMNFIQPMQHQPPHIQLNQLYGDDNSSLSNPSSANSTLTSMSSMQMNGGYVSKMQTRACARCHKVKRKCIRPGPGMPCKSCTRKRLFCESRKDGRSTNRGGRKKVKER